MTIIIINDDRCYLCGKPFENTPELSRTTHHTLPSHLNPVHNITVPVHKKCHDIITSQDTSALTAHAYRLVREVGQLSGSVEGLTNSIVTQTIIKVKK